MLPESSITKMMSTFAFVGFEIVAAHVSVPLEPPLAPLLVPKPLEAPLPDAPLDELAFGSSKMFLSPPPPHANATRAEPSAKESGRRSELMKGRMRGKRSWALI